MNLSGHTQARAIDELDDDSLLAELGVDPESADITKLRYVRSNVEKRAADEIANRERCESFEAFKPLFEKVKTELDCGVRLSGVIRKSGWVPED